MVRATVFQSGDPMSDFAGGGAGGSSRVPELVRHLTVALTGHVRRMHQEGLTVPHEVEELASFLVQIARIRQGATAVADWRDTGHYAPMPDRLLITKGEVAERLSVSVRTIERLVATGRLPQVYVEHSARFRVTDLEAYVNSLTESQSVPSTTTDPMADPKHDISCRRHCLGAHSSMFGTLDVGGPICNELKQPKQETRSVGHDV